MKQKPTILGTTPVCSSRFFNIESVHLEFSNGQKRDFERLKSRVTDAVMVLPIQDNHLILIREYSVGLEEYTLSFPKGLIDAGESQLEAANRELQEEAGFAAKNLKYLTSFSMNPGYMNLMTHLIQATDLVASTLPGDEPEPLDVVLWPLDNIPGLLAREDFKESRSIAALMFIQR
jgi:ADP-ribose diphosphatase